MFQVYNIGGKVWSFTNVDFIDFLRARWLRDRKFPSIWQMTSQVLNITQVFEFGNQQVRYLINELPYKLITALLMQK